MKKNDKNWDETGLLKGLGGPSLFIIKKFLQEIDLDSMTGYVSNFFIGACVRRTVYSIISKDNRHSAIKSDEMSSIILGLVNISELEAKVIKSCREVLPILEANFKNTDCQAELICIICNNYVNSLINEVLIGKFRE